MSSLPFDQELFDILVCPEARVALKWQVDVDGGRLVSTDPATRRAYRVVDGIPVMLIEESIVLDQAEWDAVMAGPGPVGAGVGPE